MQLPALGIAIARLAQIRAGNRMYSGYLCVDWKMWRRVDGCPGCDAALAHATREVITSLTVQAHDKRAGR